MTSLEAYLYGRHVADLENAQLGEVAIRYTPEALEVGNAARLSVSLPVREELIGARKGANRWVRSVLPESPHRKDAAKKLDLEEDDLFGLIAALGRDVAGAVVIVPAGKLLAEPGPVRIPLDRSQIAAKLSDLHDSPLGLDPELGVRISLAGQQEKLLLTRSGGRYALPVHGEPSTVILKPEPSRFPNLVDNEYFSLTLAKMSGFQTAEASVEDFEGTRTLVVERFDRMTGADGTVRRLHQEDLLTAAGRDVRHKYEVDEQAGPVGITLKQMADVVEAETGLVGVRLLFEVTVFNLLLGNADSHARNLSLLHHPDGRSELAPLYDLICTLAYDGVKTDLPQRIAGATDLDAVDVDHLIAEAKAWGLNERVAVGRIAAVVDRVRGNLGRAVDEAVSTSEVVTDAVEQIAGIVEARLARYET